MNLTREVLRQSARSWLSSDLRRSGPWWLQLVWTLLFCIAVAIGFTLLGGFTYGPLRQGRLGSPAVWAQWFGVNLGISLCIGYTIHALFELAGRLLGHDRIRRFSNPQRGLFFAGVPMLGVAIGWPLGVWLVIPDGARWFPLDRPGIVVASLLASMLISLLFYIFFATKARQIEAERRATEAQLRLLQGQIEPHFLFNTLANVLSLIERDTPKAKHMLEAFTDYLRSSLSGLRRDDSVLGTELDLAEAYLRLLQSRMEQRLRFTIEGDDSARRVTLPPLLLQPLVENAVVHGLEPQVDGGEVRVRARVEGTRLVVEVSDDGRGLDAAPRYGAPNGAGVALDNIRQRLAARYGDEASLELQSTTPGTRATLRLPIEPACPQH